MSPTTPEEREDLIIKTIEKSDGIGFNRLQKETGIPKKTLTKYLNELVKSKVISKTMKGKKPSNGVSYTVNFSEHTKKAIKHNLGQISKYHPWYTGKRLVKSNTFPHYLQHLASEYYQNMMSFLFDNVPAYKFGVKRMEELLETEKKRLDKEFKGKNKLRLWYDCQEVQFHLAGDAWDSIYDAANRRSHRSRDEIRIDCINPRILGMSTQHEQEKKFRGKGKSHGIILENSRVDYIKEKRIKKLFIELADEYDQLSKRLRTIKFRLAGITGAYPFEPTNVDKTSDLFVGI